MPLELIAQWLGHTQLETTLIYANADTKMKRDAIEKATNILNPLSEKHTIPVWKDDETLKILCGLR